MRLILDKLKNFCKGYLNIISILVIIIGAISYVWNINATAQANQGHIKENNSHILKHCEEFKLQDEREDIFGERLSSIEGKLDLLIELEQNKYNIQ